MSWSFIMKYLVRYTLLTTLSLLFTVSLVVLGLSVDLLVNGPAYLAMTVTNLIKGWNQELTIDEDDVMDGLLEARDSLWLYIPFFILVIVTSILVLVILVGCVGSCLLSYPLLSGFTMALLISLILTGLSTLWLYINIQESSTVDKFLAERIKLYSKNSSSSGLFSLMVDTVQQDLQCCGLKSPADWPSIKVPTSCCPQSCEVGWDCGKVVSGSCKKEEMFTTGCLEVVSKQLLQPGTLIGAAGISVLVVISLMVVTLILSLCLCLQARRSRIEDKKDEFRSNMSVILHWNSPISDIKY